MSFLLEQLWGGGTDRLIQRSLHVERLLPLPFHGWTLKKHWNDQKKKQPLSASYSLEQEFWSSGLCPDSVCYIPNHGTQLQNTNVCVCLCVKGLWELPTQVCRALDIMFTRSNHFPHQTTLKHNDSETVVCDQIVFFKYTLMKQRLTSLNEVCRQNCRV